MFGTADSGCILFFFPELSPEGKFCFHFEKYVPTLKVYLLFYLSDSVINHCHSLNDHGILIAINV